MAHQSKSLANDRTINKKIPTYSICNLLGSDSCMTEFLAIGLRDFVQQQPDIYFPHRHSFFQIVLFKSGGGKHSIDFQSYEVQPCQVYCMAPGQVHTWEFDQTTDGFIINFNESFFTSICHNPHFLLDFPLFNNVIGSPITNLTNEQSSEIGVIFEKILHEFSSENDYKMDILRALLLELLVRLSRLHKKPYKEGFSKHQYATLKQFEKLIEQYYHEKRLPKDYAEMLFITPNHLNALCTATVGKSAGEIIRDRILLEVKRLLANSDLTVTEISQKLNFEDNAYFSRFFKKYLGIAPEEFRKKMMV